MISTTTVLRYVGEREPASHRRLKRQTTADQHMGEDGCGHVSYVKAYALHLDLPDSISSADGMGRHALIPAGFMLLEFSFNILRGISPIWALVLWISPT